MVKLSYGVDQMYGPIEMVQYLMMIQRHPVASSLCSIYQDVSEDTEKWVIEIPNAKVAESLKFFGTNLGINPIPEKLPKGEDVWDDDILDRTYNTAAAALLAYDILRKWVEITL